MVVSSSFCTEIELVLPKIHVELAEVVDAEGLQICFKWKYVLTAG
jgi:hypothetical protein